MGILTSHEECRSGAMCTLVAWIAPFIGREDNPMARCFCLTNISSIGNKMTSFYLQTLVNNYWNVEYVPIRNEKCKSGAMCTLVSWIALVIDIVDNL
jgi:hypothetical protein